MADGIGLQEIILIAILVLLLFGPKGVSGIMRDLGRWTGKMKRYRDEFTRELMAMSEPVFTPEEIKQNERKRIREQCKKAMVELQPEEREKENKDIRTKLETLPEFISANRIFCFISKQEEVDTLTIISNLLKSGKEVFAPYCIDKTKDLGLAQISDLKSDLEPGIFNIPEPKKDLRKQVDPLSIDLFIIPGLAFDHEMTRLGRGAGYFDRFLQDIKGRKPICGICFNCQVYPYIIPPEEHDINPDCIVTPLTIIRQRT